MLFRESLDANECDPNPCQNEGSCVDGDDEYTCDCADGWTGNNCQTGSFTKKSRQYRVFDSIINMFNNLCFYLQMKMSVILGLITVSIFVTTQQVTSHVTAIQTTASPTIAPPV